MKSLAWLCVLAVGCSGGEAPPDDDDGTSAGGGSVCEPWSGTSAEGAPCTDPGAPAAAGLPAATIDLGDGFTIESNLTYGTRGGVALQGDLMRPTAPADATGILVIVHGGAWSCGRRRDGVAWWADYIARQLGIATFNIEYRQVEEGGQFPENLMDVKCAIQWIADNAANWGLDGTRIGITGESAGAHLTAMVAVTAHREDLDPKCGTSPPAVVIAAPYSGPMNLPHWLGTTTLPVEGLAEQAFGDACGVPIDGCDERRSCNRCVDASPLAHACAASAPLVLVHAPPLYDPWVLPEESEGVHRSVTDAGGTSTLVIASESDIAAIPDCVPAEGFAVETGAHGFANHCLAAATAATVEPLLGEALR